MHSQRVSAAEPIEITAGWRLVDTLTTIRDVCATRGLIAFKPVALLAPGILLVSCLLVAVAKLGWSSFHTYDDFLGTTGQFSFTQYDELLHDRMFKVVLERTVAMAMTTALIAVFLAIPFSLVFARAASRVFRLALIIVLWIPYLTGDITRTYGWIVVFGPEGPLTWFTSQLGLGFPRLLGTLWAVGAGSVQVLLPAAVVILLPAVLRLDPQLEDAASTLGARRWQASLGITLPQLRVPIIGATAVCWALGMGEFANPAILGQGLRDFFGNFLNGRYLGLGNEPQGAAIGMVMLVLVTVGAAALLTLGRLPRRPRP